MSQNGANNSPKEPTIPIGFVNKAFIKSPSKKLITDRVVPHEGQGAPVTFLKRQMLTWL